MQTFDQCLTDLVTSGEVTFETAKAASSNPSDFELKLKMFSRLSQSENTDDIPASEQPSAAETPQAVPQLDGLQSSGLDFLGQ
jgi:hypothetical protein